MKKQDLEDLNLLSDEESIYYNTDFAYLEGLEEVIG